MMGEPIWVGKVKNFTGTQEELKANRQTHEWVEEQAPVYRIPKSWVQTRWPADLKSLGDTLSIGGKRYRCSKCQLYYVSPEAEWACGSEPERYTQKDIDEIVREP